MEKPGKFTSKPPGFFRRLAIIFYDALLLIAVLILATAVVIPLNNGEAFSNTQYFFPAYLLLVSFIYYGWFWTHGGQTLGMKTWKIKVLTKNKQVLTWKHAFMRFFIALFSWLCFGLGFLWQLIDKQQRTWHDLCSRTSLFYDKHD